MSEWLTTGQMIDRLEFGEVAENENGGKVSKSIHGGIGPIDCPTKNITMSGGVVELKWRILPKYVPFEEAMKALQEGKTVRYKLEKPEEEFCYRIMGGDFYYQNILRGDDAFIQAHPTGGIGIRGIAITNGKWTIEGDS